MAEAIGNVRATFTASAAGLIGAVEQSVSSLEGLRAAHATVAAAASSASAMIATSNERSSASTIAAARAVDDQAAASTALVAAQARNAAATQSLTAAQREAARIAREVRTPAEAYAATVAKLDTFLSRGLVTQEVYSRAVSKARAEMESAMESADGQAGAMSRLTAAALAAKRAVDGLSATANGVGSAVDAIASAGSSVIQFGKDVVLATASWRLFNAATRSFTTPEGLFGIVVGLSQAIAVIRVAEAAFGALGLDVGGAADFAVKASLAFAGFKAVTASGITSASVVAYAARLDAALGVTTTITAALTRLGVSAAAQAAGFGALSTAATAAGGVLARLAAFSIPGFGQLAAAVYLTGKAFFSSRDAANELAASVATLNGEAAKLGVTFQDVQIQKALDAGRTREEIVRLGLALSALDARQFDDLALANERAAKASTDFGAAAAAIGTTISGVFVGAFAGVSEGVASLTAGFADLLAGVNAVAAPIGAVLRPAFTLIGTGVQGVLQLVGAFAAAAGAVLRFGGVLLGAGLSPFIVGLNNLADSIRAGVGAAFEWLSARIEGFQRRITRLQESLAAIPVIGQAFASGQGRVVAPAGPVAPRSAGDVAAAAKAAAEEEAAAVKSVTAAIAAQERTLSQAIATASQYGEAGFAAAVRYQEALRGLEAQLEAGILNETSFGQAAEQAASGFRQEVDAIKERNDALRSIGDTVEKQAAAGEALGALAETARREFQAAAIMIEGDLKAEIIDPTAARDQMKAAVDAMNAELKRLGEDLKFAERIRDSMKTAGERVREELAAIDANESLTNDEKAGAKAKVRERAAANLPGEQDAGPFSKLREQQAALRDAFDNGIIKTAEELEARQAALRRQFAADNLPGAEQAADDPVAKFRQQQAELAAAFNEGVINPQELFARQQRIRDELDASVADFRDEQARASGPDRRELRGADVSTSEGVAQFFRLMRGDDDPTTRQLKEAQRQTQLLERVNQALREQEVVEL